MSFHTGLKTQTSHLHDEIERIPMFSELARGHIPLEAYKRLTVLMHGYWAPLESRLVELDLPLPWHQRVFALDHDLERLNFTPAQIRALPHCSDLPDISTEANGVGVVYVYMGSQLGGAMIHKALSKTGHIPKDCRTFYAPFVANLGAYWSEFTHALDTLDFTPQQQSEAIASACDTFRTLQDWLSNTAA